MYASKIKLIALTATACVLAGCVSPYGYGGVGVGVGSGYGSYGYGGYGYDGYGYPGGYGGYGYGGYGGWYDNFYYPGSGYWVYSRDGHRHRWTPEQRRHWEQRREQRRIERAQRSPTGQWGATQDGVVAVPSGTRPEDVFVAQQGQQVQRVQRVETRRVERTQRSETRSERSRGERDNGVRRLPRNKDD